MICPMTGIFPPIARNALKTLENRFILGNLMPLPNLLKNPLILPNTVVTNPVDLVVAPNALLTAVNGLVRVLNADCIAVTPFDIPPVTVARILDATFPTALKPSPILKNTLPNLLRAPLIPVNFLNAPLAPLSTSLKPLVPSTNATFILLKAFRNDLGKMFFTKRPSVSAIP